jgi:hypothetical protein
MPVCRLFDPRAGRAPAGLPRPALPSWNRWRKTLTPGTKCLFLRSGFYAPAFRIRGILKAARRTSFAPLQSGANTIRTRIHTLAYNTSMMKMFQSGIKFTKKRARRLA